MDTLAKFIDMMNETIGQLNSLLVLPLVGVVFYEVIMRYAFNAPTVWGFEVTAFLYGVHYMLGLALTEGRGGHVKVDVLTMRFSAKTQAAINIFTYIVIFLPVWTIMAYAAVKYGMTSTLAGETNPTSFAPAIWPYKLLMALGFTMLLLQGVSSLRKNIETFRGREEEA
jgi:TRAP-type mannitol/chloroaromatic compound transport system permease small subunit